jgi:hypothetical protein
MRVDSEISVRHPYRGEVPQELMRGFEAFSIDLEWQWVVVADGQVKAQILCTNAHGLLFILRLTALKDAPHAWLFRLLREVFREAKAQGCLGYVTFVCDQNPPEIKLMRLVQKAGGMLMPQSGAWAFGSIETRY